MKPEAPPLYRTLTLRYDMANDRAEYDNPDEMTYIEVLGLIKYIEMMLTAEIVKDSE
jgi:hypothetical protein